MSIRANKKHVSAQHLHTVVHRFSAMAVQHEPSQVPEEQQDVDAELDALLEVRFMFDAAALLPACDSRPAVHPFRSTSHRLPEY